MIYRCCNENRRSAILGNPGITLNGIDYLEVLDHDAPTGSPRQQTLLVHCLNDVPTTLTPANVLIIGGERITDITAQWIAPASAPPPTVASALEISYFQALADAAKTLVIRTSTVGDFSPYTLRLVNDASQAEEVSFDLTEALSGFDPQLVELEFSFKVECGPDFDCAPPSSTCFEAPPTPPPIDYLAKDYGSFRTLMLDRLNQLLPSWGSTGEADLGVTLAELIAHAGDYLSYQQDAIATEAYLETARSRVSLRRHALLVDYHVHDGCNARTWIRLTIAGNPGQGVFLDRTLTRFYTSAPGMPSNLSVNAGNEETALACGAQVFEPMQDALLYPEHNQMAFYTWGDTECCLPQGATEATLNGFYPNLKSGDVLIFQEMIGPQSGDAADADIRHRWAVRLTEVATRDANGQPLVDPLFEGGTGLPIVSASQTPNPVTEIQWSSDDALPFPICISSQYKNSHGAQQTAVNVSVAVGNVILADHGLSFSGKDLGIVPPPRLSFPPNPAGDRCQTTPRGFLPVRFRPTVPDSPITQAVPLPLAGIPVTPSVALLVGIGTVNLTDENGLTSLMIQARTPNSWPQLFGVMVKQNQTTSANFDLSVIYNPPGGAPGMQTQVVLESFTDLSFKSTDPNFVTTRINALSRFIQVPATYVPSATAPAGFPATPTVVPNTGTVNLQDLSTPAVTYLTLQAASPVGWPGAFGVLASVNQQDASEFNLVIVYVPPSGGVGVALPVTVERFSGLSLATIGGKVNSNLVTAACFTGTPDLNESASNIMNYDPSDAVPEINLMGNYDGTASQWNVKQDLLESTQSDRVFVVEIESDGTATLRFATPSDPDSASDANGLVPDSGTAFIANYRIGNGTSGNVGADSLICLAASDARIQSCTNPLPASGGTDLETNDQIRRRAPQAFLAQERSVTMADYEAIAETDSRVDQAVASLRWTGSWYSVFIAVEPKGGGDLTPTLQESLQESVERYRLAGQDLKLESPQYVSLQITLEVSVDPGYFQSDVEQSLLQVLGNQILPNGQKGLFYPDNFTFGQTVYLSPVYKTARSVSGVVLVTATQFQPQGVNSTRYLTTGEIKLGTLQVARLDNDPSYPSHGQLTLVMRGGK